MRHKVKKFLTFVDYVLFYEDTIRQGVKEAREEFSLYGSTRADIPSGGKNKKSDRTVAAVIHRAEKIECVVCPLGTVVHNPEEWLKIIDTVRREAAGKQYHNFITAAWENIYKRGSQDYYGMDIWKLVDKSGDAVPEWDSLSVLRWIRNRMMELAEEAGLWTRESKSAEATEK